MNAMRHVPQTGRALLAAAFVLLIAIRLLSPAGFMPAFDRGAVTIIACPDGEMARAQTATHHHDPKIAHQSCPYAASSGPGTFDGLAQIDAVQFDAETDVLTAWGIAVPTLQRANDRPPPRGPPTQA